MSNGSYLIYREINDNYHYRHVTYSGHVDGVGQFLIKYCSTEETVQKIINFNVNFQDVCVTKEMITQNVNQRYQNVKKDYNLFFIESWALLGRKSDKQIRTMESSYLEIEKLDEAYIYLYEHGKWLVKNYMNSDFLDLKKSMQFLTKLNKITEEKSLHDLVSEEIKKITFLLKTTQWHDLIKESKFLSVYEKDLIKIIQKEKMEYILEEKSTTRSAIKI